jgi:transcriptional regulator GlxA family with amidase domain
MRFGIFIYDGVEPIDLATYGVLSMARRIAPMIQVCTIAPNAGITLLSNGLRVVAEFGIDNAPPCDLVIVTGGPGWSAQAESSATLDYVRKVYASSAIASVWKISDFCRLVPRPSHASASALIRMSSVCQTLWTCF